MKNSKFVKICSGVVIGGLVSLPVVASAAGFTDVKSDYWAASVIQKFVGNGYIGGYSDGTFKPDKSITRAEFVKIVNKVFGYSDVGSENFTDVSSGQWYYNDVCIAMKAGYISGYADNTFRPNKEITREEVAAIVTNIKNNKDTEYDKINEYKDGDKISNWAKSSVEGALEAGYLGGYADNTLRSKANITRAESVTILSRIPSDNTEVSKVMYTTGDPVLNVRSGPGTNYENIDTLPKGTKVEVVGESNGWAKIKYNNGYAYVSSSYLVESIGQKPLPELSTTPSYVDAPQNADVISSAQDVNQSKIKFEINARYSDLPTGISVKSTAGDFNVNYTVYSNNGEFSASNGATAQISSSSPIEAMKVSLENAPTNYHIFYRTKIQNQGWQAWVKDGTISGQIGSDSKIEDIQVRLVVSDKADEMVKPTIAVDIGHNVTRPTARGSVSGIYSEDYLTKAIGEKVIYKLRSKGYNVVNTLPQGQYTQSDELKYRVNVANKNKVDKFVSIHFNSYTDASGNGTEVYYNTKAGASDMADKIATNVSGAFGFKNKGKQPQGELYLLLNTNMPAVIVESCYITNQGDMDKFIAKGTQAYDVLADAIVNGIIN